MLNLLPETLNNPGGAVNRLIFSQPESAATPETSGSDKSRAFAKFLPEKSGKVKKYHYKSPQEPHQHSKTPDTRMGVLASYGTVSEKRTVANALGRSVPFHTFTLSHFHTTPNPALHKTKMGATPAFAGAGFLSSNKKASDGNPGSATSNRMNFLTGVSRETKVEQPSQTEKAGHPSADGLSTAESSPKVLTADTDLNSTATEITRQVFDHGLDRIPLSELARYFRTVVVVKNSSDEVKLPDSGTRPQLSLGQAPAGGNDSSRLKSEESAQEAGMTDKPRSDTNAVKPGVRDGDKHDAANSDKKENNHTPKSGSRTAEQNHTVLDGKQGDVLKANKTPAQQGSSTLRQGSKSSSTLPQPDRTELVSNIKLNLAAGRKELTLRLKPEVLGKALIIFNQGEDGLKLEFRVDHPDVRRVIEAESVQLREALNAAGIQTTSIEVRAADEDNKRFTQADENSEHKNQNKEQSRDEDNHQPGEHPLKPRYFGYNSFDIAA